jgi:glycosyltransferase involved in cell wall biosynthesis
MEVREPRDARRDHEAARLAAAHEQIRGLERRLADAEHRADALQAALSDTRAHLDAILGSRFWRCTRPVRASTRAARRSLRPVKAWARRLVEWARLRSRRARAGARRLGDALRHPPAFPAAQEVVVSIVIATRNQCYETLACLRAIRERTGTPGYEVIVVDECSRDLTPLIVGRIEGLVYFRTWRRPDLAGSYIRGAARARGKFLVFLRPGAVVTHRWLDELLETFTHFPEAGLAVSRLVPAGGRLTATSEGPLACEDDGRDDPGDPRDRFAREVADGSTACVMVPTALFRTLRGLATRPASAGGPEIDLALPIRRQGHRVIYQPLSRVIVRAGRSSTDLPTPASDLRPTHHRSPGRARGRPLPRILVIDDVVPTHDKDAGSLRLSRILGILRGRASHVTFLPDNLALADPYTRDLQRIGVEVLYRHHPYVDSVEGFLQDHGAEYSLIWICRPELTSRLVDTARAFAPAARLVFDTIDLHFLRVGREAALRGDPALKHRAERLREQELATARAVDFTIVVSEDERRLVLEHAGPLDVRIVPTIHAVEPPLGGFQDRSGILFLGGFNHAPNVDAVQYFVEAIFPELRRTIPGVKFYVVGSNPPDAVRGLACEDVVVTGYVPDVTGYLRGSRLSVAPLRFGAGVKGKVNMSMAHGLPVVVTSIAAEGMHLNHGTNVLIADDPAAFIASIQQLYRSEPLWTRLSVAGLENVAEHFSFEVAAREIDRLLEDAGLLVPSRAGSGTAGRLP